MLHMVVALHVDIEAGVAQINDALPGVRIVRVDVLPRPGGALVLRDPEGDGKGSVLGVGEVLNPRSISVAVQYEAAARDVRVAVNVHLQTPHGLRGVVVEERHGHSQLRGARWLRQMAVAVHRGASADD